MSGTSTLNLLAVTGLLNLLPAATPLPRHVLQSRDGSAIRVVATQNPQARAAKLRANFISKIAPYLKGTGKNTKKDPAYRIGVIGKDLVAGAMHKFLPGKSVGKRKIQVAALPAKKAATATACKFDLLYIATTVDPATLAAVIKAHKKLGTTLFSSRPGFAKAGGGIQLFVRNNKLRFEVNHDALKRQGLRVSPHLLNLSARGPTR